MPNATTTMTDEERAQREQRLEEHKCAAQLLIAEIRGSQRTDLQKAKKCGDYLIKAKAEVDVLQPGRWTVWLEANFDLTVQTARKYIRIAEHSRDAEDWRLYDVDSIEAYDECIRHDERRSERGQGCTAVENTYGSRDRELMKCFTNSIRETTLDPFGGGIATTDNERGAMVFAMTNPIGQRSWAQVRHNTKKYMEEHLVPQLKEFYKEQLLQHFLPKFHQWRQERDQVREENRRRMGIVVRRRATTASAEALTEQPQPDQPLPEPDQPLPAPPVRIIQRRRFGQTTPPNSPQACP